MSFHNRKLAIQQQHIRQYCLLSHSANSLIHLSSTSKECLITENWPLRKEGKVCCGGSSFWANVIFADQGVMIMRTMCFLSIDFLWFFFSDGIWPLKQSISREIVDQKLSFEAWTFLIAAKWRFNKVLVASVWIRNNNPDHHKFLSSFTTTVVELSKSLIMVT